eukprot:472685-Prorocentrum_lima.AAC.1
MGEYLATSEEQHKDAARKALSFRRALEEADRKISNWRPVSTPPKSEDDKGNKEEGETDNPSKSTHETPNPEPFTKTTDLGEGSAEVDYGAVAPH